MGNSGLVVVIVVAVGFLLLAPSFLTKPSVKPDFLVSSNSLGILNVNRLNWGVLHPGDSVSKTVYVKNVDNVTLRFTVFVSGWVPEEAEDYMIFSYRMDSELLEPDEVSAVVLNLRVASNVRFSDFGFNITVQGSLI